MTHKERAISIWKLIADNIDDAFSYDKDMAYEELGLKNTDILGCPCCTVAKANYKAYIDKHKKVPDECYEEMGQPFSFCKFCPIKDHWPNIDGTKSAFCVDQMKHPDKLISVYHLWENENEACLEFIDEIPKALEEHWNENS